MKSVATLTSKGQVTVPKGVRKALGVRQGDGLEFALERGQVVVRAVKPKRSSAGILSRHLTHDDPAQTALVERLIADAEVRGEPVFLSHVVLCELCWTLASVYRMPKAAVVAALEALLDDRAFLIQERGQVEEALTSFRR